MALGGTGNSGAQGDELLEMTTRTLVRFSGSGYMDGKGREMTPRICRCCGENIALGGNQMSRNPNVCASCSSMLDGMEEATEEGALRAEGPRVPDSQPPDCDPLPYAVAV